MDNNQKKPLILEIEEAKIELAQCVNHIIQDRGIPCYFLEPTLSEILAQVKACAKNEIAHAQAHMNGAEQSAPQE